MENYLNKIKITMIWVITVEDRKATTTRFFNRLNQDITNIIELQYHIE